MVNRKHTRNNNKMTRKRHVSERYIAKSDPYIVMVSTPNAPDGWWLEINKHLAVV